MKILITTIIGAGALLTAFFVLNRGESQSTERGEKSELSWVSFDEGALLAKQQNKKLLVDVYTDWCSWCKKMDSDVYSNPEVIKLMQAKFIPVKLNAESSRNLTFDGRALTEAQFAGAVGVTGYPTTLFLHSDAKPITSLPGYLPADRFADVLRYIGDDHYKTVSFQDFLSKSKAPH